MLNRSVCPFGRRQTAMLLRIQVLVLVVDANSVVLFVVVVVTMVGALNESICDSCGVKYGDNWYHPGLVRAIERLLVVFRQQIKEEGCRRLGSYKAGEREGIASRLMTANDWGSILAAVLWGETNEVPPTTINTMIAEVLGPTYQKVATNGDCTRRSLGQLCFLRRERFLHEIFPQLEEGSP